MKLGFLTAALPGSTLEQAAKWGAESGFQAIEIACWPLEKATRRYAGVTHIDVKFHIQPVATVKNDHHSTTRASTLVSMSLAWMRKRPSMPSASAKVMAMAPRAAARTMASCANGPAPEAADSQ